MVDFDNCPKMTRREREESRRAGGAESAAVVSPSQPIAPSMRVEEARKPKCDVCAKSPDKVVQLSLSHQAPGTTGTIGLCIGCLSDAIAALYPGVKLVLPDGVS